MGRYGVTAGEGEYILRAMQDWQLSLKNAVSDPLELCRLLALEPDLFGETLAPIKSFSLRVPREFIARMEKGNPKDPLLLQVFPQALEMIEKSGFVQDPLEEKKFNPLPGLLHKYHGRVLLILQGACAVNCRYCFRRHFPYEENMMGMSHWGPIIDYIAKDPSIEEVIFNGGDPLIMKDKQLAQLAREFDKIPHLKVLRFHTRVPVMIPSRINSEFLAWMNELRMQKILVIHANHPREIDEDVQKALLRLRDNHVQLLNQSVLLKNINDDPQILMELSKKLFASYVLPYYLHLLDPVAGTAHYEVELDEALRIMDHLRTHLPGYLVPKLVREIAGEESKIEMV